jgi:hypothetical protein
MPETMAPNTPGWTTPTTPSVEDLEQRLQRLEDVVASVCDTQSLEDRVVERVQEKLRSETPLAPPPIAAFAPDGTGPHPSEAEYHSKQPLPPPSGFAWVSELTLFGEMWQEVRALFRMIRDPVYRTSWLCRIVPVLCLLYVTVWSWVSAYLFGSIPILSMIDDLAVVYIGLKVLGRELRRYREFEARWRR